jgi:hypothetical protein
MLRTAYISPLEAETFKAVKEICLVISFFYYSSQRNDYQEIIHVICVNEFIGGTILLHVA